ncbi:uncharacterized protein LOC125037709, partial [Penaeus chinensis]|uniref:uncharacterized protein LOC125037709 n=1 Tax=Penaeus chinensis TaxID=139456 RepID=UPI001FB79D78
MNVTIFILLVASICSSGVATAGSPDSAPPQPGIEIDHAARRMPRLALLISGSTSTASEVSSAGTTPETTTSEATKGLTPDITSTYATPQITHPGSASLPPTAGLKSTAVAASPTPIPPSSSTFASTATTSELTSPATTPETSSTNSALQTTTTYISTTTNTTFTSQGLTTAGTTSETSTIETTSGTTPEPGRGASSTSTSPGTSPESTPAASTPITNPGTSTESTQGDSTSSTNPGTSTESTQGDSTSSTNPGTSTESTPGDSTKSTPTASTTDISTGTSIESIQTTSTTDISPGTSTESTPAASTTVISTENSTESTPTASTTDISTGTSTESTPTSSTTDVSTENSTESIPTASTTDVSTENSTESTPTASTTDVSTENSTESIPTTSTTDVSTENSTESIPTTSTTDVSTENSTESIPTTSTTDISTGTSTKSTPAASTTDISTENSTESIPTTSTTDISTENSTESIPTTSTTDVSTENSTDSIPTTSTTDISSETSTAESTPTAIVSVSPTITSFPPTCSVDPDHTTIEAQITLPRTLVVAWGNAAPPSVTVCLQEDCRTTAASPVQFDEVTAGRSLLVTVTGTDFFDCVQLFVPWQFRIGVAAHNLTLDWVNFSPRLLNVCVATDIGHFPSYSSWIDCKETTSSIASFSGLEPDTPFWVRVGEATVFHATTSPVAKYRSLAFRCHETGVCVSGECRPASDGLLLALDLASPVPVSYPYTCVDKDNAQSSPATLISASRVLAITSVVFESGGLEQDIEECIHTTAMAIVKYWCDGMENCTVEHSFLHSHLAVAEGCVDTRLDQYSLHIKYKDAVSDPTCRVGTSLFAPHKTCYDVETSTDLPARRRSCMEAGGDIAFYDSDPAFLQFLNETFDLSEKGLLVQGIIGYDVRPREPQLYAKDVDTYNINSEIHYVMSHHSFAYDVPILCAYPPLVGVPDRLETATISDDPCWSSPCLNGGTCFNTTLALNAAAASGDEFMCLCRDGYSGNLCENANTGIKDEPQDPLDGVYSFSAPSDKALSFEFVFFGRVWAESQSCYAPAALALFRLKCDGQSQCEVSYTDLHHHLHSSCHPAVTPTLRVRYATYESPENWSCGAESLVESTCLGTSPDRFRSAQDAKLYCAGMGGDLASTGDPTPSLCLNNASSLWVDNTTDFRAHPHYALTPVNPTSISCDGQALQSHTALCVFPFVFFNSSSTTTEETTTISTTEETTPKITSTASTTSTTTTTTPAPPGPCPETRPFPSAYPDYVWKQEEPGTRASNNCPKPKNVTVHWLCKANGKWDGLPDLSLCSTIDTGHWEDEIKNSTENAGDSLNNFLNMTESQELEPGDVTGTLNILGAARERHIEDLKNMNESEVLNATDVYTMAVTKTTNKMLQQPEVRTPWRPASSLASFPSCICAVTLY